MIRFLPEADFRLEKGCLLFPASGTQIYGYASRYGGGFPFCTSWAIEDEKGETVGALGRFNGSLRLSCGSLEPSMLRELGDFLAVLSWDTLEGPAGVVEELAMARGLNGPGHILWGYAMERRERTPCLIPEGPPILEGPELSEVFWILRGSAPEFAGINEMEWRRDASHMLRHGGGLYISAGGQAVAGITAYAPGWGLIAKVATLPESRGRGYASALTAWCVNILLETGRGAVLLCGDGNNAAERIYKRLGFAQTGRFAVLTRDSF